MSIRLVGAVACGLALSLHGCSESPVQSDVPPSSRTTVEPADGPPAAVDGRVTGGGFFREDGWHVSFAGQVRGWADEWGYVEWADADRWTSGEPRGRWVVQFHKVPDPELSGRTFRASEIVDASFALKRVPLPGCARRAIFNAVGTLDGMPGWRVWAVMADAGPGVGKDYRDSFRVVLYAPVSGDAVFDTFDTFTPNATCLGGKKRNLDGGNLTIHLDF